MTQENVRMSEGGVETDAKIHIETGERGLSERMRLEARRKITPIYMQSQEKGPATAMFLALDELQRLYPNLNEAELETLFVEVMREVERAAPNAMAH